MELAEPDDDWEEAAASWEDFGHQGPFERFPITEMERRHGVIWCRRCCRTLFVHGAATKSAVSTCRPAAIALRGGELSASPGR